MQRERGRRKTENDRTGSKDCHTQQRWWETSAVCTSLCRCCRVKEKYACVWVCVCVFMCVFKFSGHTRCFLFINLNVKENTMPTLHWFNSLIGGWVSRTVLGLRWPLFKSWGRCFHRDDFHYRTGKNKLLSTCLFVTTTFPFHIIERAFAFHSPAGFYRSLSPLVVCHCLTRASWRRFSENNQTGGENPSWWVDSFT